MMKKHLGFSTTSAFTAMVFACSGCSFLFTTKAPSQPERLPPNERIECTSSKAAPIIDTIVGGLEVVRTGVALGADDSDYRNVAISREADIALGVAFSALFISSAAYGYTVTSRCSALKEDRLERPTRTPANTACLWSRLRSAARRICPERLSARCLCAAASGLSPAAERVSSRRVSSHGRHLSSGTAAGRLCTRTACPTSAGLRTTTFQRAAIRASHRSAARRVGDAGRCTAVAAPFV